MDSQLYMGDNLTDFREAPIHISGQVQPHGIVLVLEEPELRILQVSSNINSVLGIPPENLLLTSLEELLDPFQVNQIKAGLSEQSLDTINPTKIWLITTENDYLVFDAVFHHNSQGFLILELEPTFTQENTPFLSLYHLAKTSINRIENSANLQDYCQIIVREVRKVTGFDRVILYKFYENGHGSVVAEDKLENLEPYLGLHYPKSDIPKPARQLFIDNLIRLIPNTHAESVEIFPLKNPINQQPLDLTKSILRSAADCHIEYLHNMGVGASLTISLIQEGHLWGLITCHHQTPKYVSYELRKACEFLGRVIFSEISGKEETEDCSYRMHLTDIKSRLIESMSQEDNFIDGLITKQPNILDLTGAQGAVIFFGGQYTFIGQTPEEEDLNLLVQWLQQNVNEEIFVTDSLSQLYSDAERYKNVASGLLAIPISKCNYVLWFRPEVIQTVDWGGDPNKPFEVNKSQGNLRLHPRKSFELWKQTVRSTSLPWQYVEIKAALELRKAIVNIVLRQADELVQLNQDLQRSNAELKKFAYVASHDLQAPLKQVANYVQLLETQYHHKLDANAQEFINYAAEGVNLMQTLVDNVLAYSNMDTQAIAFQAIKVKTALDRALANLRQLIRQSQAIITHDQLPIIMADETQIMQLLQNLIENAIKFRSDKSPKINIAASLLKDEWLFSITDNGIGIDPQFSDRIFVLFQRLHTRDEYPGNGMGLAVCKKIVECHQGRIWVESQLGKGATFHFTIPIGVSERKRRNGCKSQNNFFGKK